MTLKGQSQGHSDLSGSIYLPVAYYHLNLDVTKGNLLAAGFSAVPAVFLVSHSKRFEINGRTDTGL